MSAIQFHVVNKGQSHTFETQRDAIQWARSRWSVGRKLDIHVRLDTGFYVQCVTYRKIRGQQFEYIGTHVPRS